MKKLLALLLAVVMLFALAACDTDSAPVKDDDDVTTTAPKDDTGTTAPEEEVPTTTAPAPAEETLEGDWVATIAANGEMMGLEGLDAELEMIILATFEEDTFTLSIDADALAVAMQKFLDDALDYMVEMVYEESGLTPDEAEAAIQEAYGMSVRELCQASIDEMDLDSMLEEAGSEMEASGEYTVEGDKLTMTVDGEAMEFTFELDGDKLSLTSEDEDFVEFLEPLGLEALEFVKK